MSQSYLNGFKGYLRLERSMSENTVEAYLRDVSLLCRYLEAEQTPLTAATLQQLQAFLETFETLELSANTQARILSGIRSFYRYLLLEGAIREDPTELLESPKQTRPLPVVLSIEEIEQLFTAIDHSTAEGQRNRAMLELMYSCGLRVSELVSLRLSDLYLDIDFIRVTGKGNKERLVPVGSLAKKQTELYLQHTRPHIPVKPQHTDTLFLNRRGAGLSRVMVFLVIKELAEKAGLEKNIHPHTFRHSFATHLVEAGADLRAVQEMMGHKSITTTEIYTHLDKSVLRATMEQYHPRYQ